MKITAKNRTRLREWDVHDAILFSIEGRKLNGEVRYFLRAMDTWKTEREFFFLFSGVTSCSYIGERRETVLGEWVNDWYSLPCEAKTPDEEAECLQHERYKAQSLLENIRSWERIYPAKAESERFRVVFFLPTPAYLEIECEELWVESLPKWAAPSREGFVLDRSGEGWSELPLPTDMRHTLHLLEQMRERCAVYIGSRSLQKLCTFLSGYEAAIAELHGAPECFDSLFQRYIEAKIPPTGGAHTKHWDEIILEHTSEETAFDAFYAYLDDFRRELQG